MSKEEYSYTDDQVDYVSSFLQGHMARKQITQMTADECADLLDRSGLLPAGSHPKRGFRFREMLRNGRDGEIQLVDGAEQDGPNTRWVIRRMT